MKAKSWIARLGGPLLFVSLWFLPTPSDMPPEAQRVLAVTAWVVAWWVTEALPIPVTSLLPLILFPGLGLQPIASVSAHYAHPMVYLFLGGFILALAMEQTQLHRRIALRIVLTLGTNLRRMIWGSMVATAFLSMWISNTATTLMMLPIALAIASQFGRAAREEETGLWRNFRKVFVLGIAYSASIGGMATLVGTPTNPIFSGFVETTLGLEVSFASWMLLAFPLSVGLLWVCWFWLTRYSFPLPYQQLPTARATLQEEMEKLGPIRPAERRVAWIFGLVALAWMGRKYLINPFAPGVTDTVIALVGAAVLFLLPGNERGEPLLSWRVTKRLPWGVLLLFGAGFAIADAFQQSELSQWLGERLTLLEALHPLVLVLVITALVNFLTELTMNVATCTMILPVLAGLATTLGLHPFILMVPATLAASCAFMLPVATAPNAIVFGSGEVEIRDMVRAGFSLNLISICVITCASYFLIPLLWRV